MASSNKVDSSLCVFEIARFVIDVRDCNGY